MANSRFTQFFLTKHAVPILLDCNIAIGGTGAVGTVVGPGITGVTRLTTGTYKVQFQENYFKYYGLIHSIASPVTGGSVTAGSFVTGTAYIITALGNTNWNAIGLPTGITAAVGQGFVATGAGSGTGTAKAAGVSGITTVEVIGNTSLQLGPQGVSNQGGYIIVQCLGATDSSTTTLIPKDPASGSTLYLAFYLSNSSVVVSGE